MLSVVLHMRYTAKVSEEEMTSLHSTRPLPTNVGVLGGAPAATDALSPSHGLRAALSSSVFPTGRAVEINRVRIEILN
jgi:hypothetical protein